MQKKIGRPSKKLDYYQSLVSDKLNIQHNCYSLIKSATTFYELEQIFIFELDNRFNIIRDLKKKQNSNQNINNITNILDIYSLEKPEVVVDNLERYLYYLSSVSDNFIKEKSFSIKSISLEELLFNKNWSRDYYTRLFEHLDSFFKIETNGEIKFSDFYDLSDILKLPLDNYELYKSIRKDIIEYVTGNKEIFKNIYKSAFDSHYSEELVTYSISFLNRWLDDDIFSSLKKTISLLKEYNLFEKYKIQLQQAYVFKGSNITVESKSNKLDIAKYSIPKKIIDLQLNFSYSLKHLQNEIAEIYRFVNESDNLEYNLLFSESFDKIENIIKHPANRLKITKIIANKYENLGNEKEKKIKVLVEYFLVQLFCFDSLLFNAKQKDIEMQLFNEYYEFSFEEGDFFPEKSSYYSELLEIIIFQKYKEFSHSKLIEKLLVV